MNNLNLFNRTILKKINALLIIGLSIIFLGHASCQENQFEIK